MYQVLIADDELSVLKSLMDGIQWEELGLTVAAAVNNGEEALQILKTGEIDIAILDIRMPGLNGLEICEKLCREQENLQLILISGYAEFSYAERAIRYGVLGYCLKPIEFEHLTRFLLKAERNCEKQNAQLPDSDLLDVLERGDQETLKKILKSSGMEKEAYVAVTVGENPVSVKGACMVELGREQYGYFMKKPLEPDVLEAWTAKKENLGIGYEKEKIPLEKLSETLNECQVRAFQYFIDSGEKVCCRQSPGQNDFLHEIRAKISANQWNQIADSLKELTEKGWQKFDVRYALRLCNLVHSGNLFREEENDYYVYSIRQLTSQYRNMRDMLKRLTDDIREARESEEKQPVYSNMAFMELMSYINENYKKDISLASAANNCYMTPNYVSQLFKKETGMTFVHYITQLRMEEAVRLLETTKKSTAEICSMVGYNDYFYFLRIFKKYTGKTIKQYRAEL